MNKRRFHQRRHNGFTLVELVLVILIVGVIAAIAMPRFAQASARQQLEAAARRVEADLNQARIRARAASRSVTVTFDVNRNLYQFNNEGGEATIVELGMSPYNVSIANADFSGNAKAYFNGYGLPASGGTVTLSSGSGKINIVLNQNGEASR